MRTTGFGPTTFDSVTASRPAFRSKRKILRGSSSFGPGENDELPADEALQERSPGESAGPAVASCIVIGGASNTRSNSSSETKPRPPLSTDSKKASNSLRLTLPLASRSSSEEQGTEGGSRGRCRRKSKSAA